MTGIGSCTDTEVVIPEVIEGYTVTSIGGFAFEDCSSLTSVTIGSSAASIGYYAFHACTRLCTIQFTGTRAQWEAISKGSGWKAGSPAFTVICSDGEIYLLIPVFSQSHSSGVAFLILRILSS